MISFSSEPDFLVIRVSTTKEFKEVELLLLSRAIPFSIRNDYWQKLFYIPQDLEKITLGELQQYIEENRNWPPKEDRSPPEGFPFSALHVLIVICLAFFHWTTRRVDLGFDWMKQGQFVASQVMDGEWWRLVTALTLHVDDAHVFSNIVGLVIFVGGVSYFVGPGLSWLLVIISAAGGNLMNALFSQTNQPGIGASTAVFAAVGLISIFGIRHYYRQRKFNVRYFVPLMAGFGIFAMLGTSPQTDVSAHLFGFLMGTLTGLVFLPFANPIKLKNKLIQGLSLLVAFSIVYGSWVIPLR